MQHVSEPEDQEILHLLDRQIQTLANNSNLPIADLRSYSDIQATFNSVKLAATMLYDTTSYPQLVDILRRNKPKGSFIEGTIGYYLFACLDNPSEQIDPSCSLLCLNSIPSQQSTGCCQYQVWSLRNGKLQKHTPDKVTSPDAYLYVSDGFQTLTREQAEILRKNSIDGIHLVYSSNGNYRVENERKTVAEISSLPKMGSAQSVPAVQAINQLPPGSGVAYVEGQPNLIGNPLGNQPSAVVYRAPTSNWTWLWVIIIILVILALIWFFNRNKNQTTTTLLV